MTAALVVELVLKLAEVLLRQLPPPEQAKAKRELAQAFIAGKLAELDAYAQKRRRER